MTYPLHINDYSRLLESIPADKILLVYSNWCNFQFHRTHWFLTKYSSFILSNKVSKSLMWQKSTLNILFIKLCNCQRVKKRKTPSTYLLINLSIVDLLRVILDMVMVILSAFNRKWLYGKLGKRKFKHFVFNRNLNLISSSPNILEL